MTDRPSAEAIREFGMAIKLGNHRAVRSALATGWPPDGWGPPEWTPLRLTAEHQRPLIAALLIERGAAVELASPEGSTALAHSIDAVVDRVGQGATTQYDWTHVAVLLDADASLASTKDIARYGEEVDRSFNRFLESRTASPAENASKLLAAIGDARNWTSAESLPADLVQILLDLAPSLAREIEPDILPDAAAAVQRAREDPTQRNLSLASFNLRSLRRVMEAIVNNR